MPESSLSKTPDVQQAEPRLLIPGYAEQLPEISSRFAEVGALGVLVIDTTPLEEIEQAYGARAYLKAHEGISALLMQLAEYRLEPDDMLTSGKSGVDELSVFVFRPRSDHRFYREELPALADAFAEHLRHNSHRIAFPYKKNSFSLPVGHAFSLHNSAFRAERLVRRAMEQARQEARLNMMLDAQRRRRQFFDVLLREEIRSIYEPIVNLATQENYGYEALVRGTNKDSLVSPAALFSAAELSGLTFEFDCLCRQTGLKQVGDRLRPGEKLFLNCLPSWVHDSNFHREKLQQTLDLAKLKPSDIVFEISEKESIDNFDYLREARDHFGNLGFLIALDDTGVGYSSLESVMKLSPDFIKVDMSLVKGVDQDQPQQELLRALQSVAFKLSTTMIAEGIETPGELITLLEIGIPYGQGFLFSRPSGLLKVYDPETDRTTELPAEPAPESS
ncbi:MAG: EAL domain-containing protein [Acidobacteriota bacterium]|nr:EAL domain-containing protein [Acidobacteriota bacterium]